jgi:hypothetical protein
LRDIHRPDSNGRFLGASPGFIEAGVTDHWVPLGEDTMYRIPLIPNARRFETGHRIRQPRPVNGTSSLNTIRSSLRLLIHVLG